MAYFLMSQIKSSRYRQFLPVLNSLRSLRSGLKSFYADAIKDIAPEKELLDLDCEDPSAEDRLTSHYLQSHLNGLLVVEDKISMAHSLESRTPMLDNEMLQLSQSIPMSLKLYNGNLKAIIRQAGVGRLHPDLYSQPKRGFPTPLRFWLRGPLLRWFTPRIIGSDSALRLMFRDEWLTQVYSTYIILGGVKSDL